MKAMKKCILRPDNVKKYGLLGTHIGHILYDHIIEKLGLFYIYYMTTVLDQ